MLNNGVGDYLKAMTAAQRATEYPGEMIAPTWASVEFIERRGGTAGFPARRWTEFAALLSSPRLPSGLSAGR